MVWRGEGKEEEHTGRGRSIYDIMDISGSQAIVFSFFFSTGFLGLPPGILARQAFVVFFWKKQACEGAWGVYVLFTTIVLTRDSTRRAGAGFILKKLCFKESKHSFFIPTLCFARLVMSIHPLAS
jgi:hypothetical protein